MKKRLLSSAALMMSLTLAASACSSNANAPSEEGDGQETPTSLNVAYSEGGKTLDPAEANDGTSDTLVISAYDQLVTYDTEEVDGKRVAKTEDIVPMLAESWEANEDKTEYTFQLRDDVTFQNGKEMTADDVVATFKHIEESASASFLYGMAGIETVSKEDESTVVIGLDEPNHLFLQILPMYSFSIIDMDQVEDEGGSDWLARNTAGSGPYVVDEWDPASEATLTRNDSYWGDEPEIETVNMKFIGSPSNRVQLLESGSVDMSLEVPTKDIETLEENPDVTVDSRASNKILYFAMNNEIEPFDNEKVRQAISYAVPYDKLLDDVMYGQASRMKSSVASSTPGFTDAGYSAEYDPEKAKELLAEAGYPDGFTFDFTLGSGFNDWNDSAVLIQASLADIGVTMNIKNMARAQFLEAIAEGNVQSYISRWTSFVNDPGYHLGLLLTSEGTSNYGNYHNEKVDELWQMAANEPDQEVRKDLYEQAQEIINVETPWAYLYEYNIVVSHRDGVEGYTSYPDALLRFFQMSKS